MTALLQDSDLNKAMTNLPDWKLEGKAIQRIFQFSDFGHAMVFVNKVAEEAEEANHHPDITVSYNRVTLSLTSHDAGGLTKRDVKMAQKFNSLAA